MPLNKEEFLGELDGQFSPAVELPGQKDARVALSALEVPTTRNEYWKYTRVSRLFKSTPHLKEDSTPKVMDPVHEDAIRLEFVQGRLVALPDGLPQGLSIFNLSANGNGISSAIREKLGSFVDDKEIFSQVNRAFAGDILCIQVEKDTSISPVIEIHHRLSGEGTLALPHIAVNVENGSKVHMTEVFTPGASSWQNGLKEVFVGPNAKFYLNKVELGEAGSSILETERIVQQEGSSIHITTVSIGEGWVRNNLSVRVEGENAHTELNGASIAAGKGHHDHHTMIDHRMANCTSDQMYKGVFEDDSQGVYNGKVYVRQDAQKIDAFQFNGNVLLSEKANVYSKPELEIYADDVKCSHGSTTGMLDQEAVEYLRCRGIGRLEAEKMLVEAFVGEALERIDSEEVQAYLAKELGTDQDEFEFTD